MRSAALPGTLFLKYEDVVADPEREFRRVAAFLGLPYDPAMAAGAGNTEGIPAWEYAWKARALEGISRDRRGVWERELGGDEVARMELLGGRALAALGYPLRGGGNRPSVWFLPRLLARLVAWRLVRNLRIAAAEYFGLRPPFPPPAAPARV